MTHLKVRRDVVDAFTDKMSVIGEVSDYAIHEIKANIKKSLPKKTTVTLTALPYFVS